MSSVILAVFERQSLKTLRGLVIALDNSTDIHYLYERKRIMTAKSTFLPGLATHCRAAVIPVGVVNYDTV